MSKTIRITRTPDGPGDIVGSAEAAEILGVERTRIARYQRKGVMPAPIALLRATPVWARADIEALRDRREEQKAVAA